MPLTDDPFDAMVSFVFNVGAADLQRSTLRRQINQQERALVPAEFMKWVWAAGRRLMGLVRQGNGEAITKQRLCRLSIQTLVRRDRDSPSNGVSNAPRPICPVAFAHNNGGLGQGADGL